MPQQILPQMPPICHICKLLHVQIQGKNVSMYTSYELTLINNVTRNTVYISHYWLMPMNKYACHTAYVGPTTCLLLGAY